MVGMRTGGFPGLDDALLTLNQRHSSRNRIGQTVRGTVLEGGV